MTELGPTPKQKRYAKDLGIKNPGRYSRKKLGKLINERVKTSDKGIDSLFPKKKKKTKTKRKRPRGVFVGRDVTSSGYVNKKTWNEWLRHSKEQESKKKKGRILNDSIISSIIDRHKR